MVVVSNPGTYGTRKCSSWCADIHKSKDPEYKHPDIQHSKISKFQKTQNPQKMQDSVDVKSVGFLGFWIVGFVDCWMSGFLDFGFSDFLCFTLVFPICRNSSKIGFGKKGICIGIYSVFKGDVCVVGGG